MTSGMRGVGFAVVLGGVVLAGSSVAAQTVPPPVASTDRPAEASLMTRSASEWMVTAGPALGVVVLHSEGGHRYVLQTVSWGKVLTDARGPGILRGRFEWAFEAMPVFAQFEPTRTYGVGASPLVWRWNFEPRGRVATFVELAGGGLWTSEPVPDRTTTSNFTAHAGYSLRYFVSASAAVVLGYRFHHISNGNRLERNPGVNAHVIHFGFAHVRGGR